MVDSWILTSPASSPVKKGGLTARSKPRRYGILQSGCVPIVFLVRGPLVG